MRVRLFSQVVRGNTELVIFLQPMTSFLNMSTLLQNLKKVRWWWEGCSCSETTQKASIKKNPSTDLYSRNASGQEHRISTYVKREKVMWGKGSETSTGRFVLCIFNQKLQFSMLLSPAQRKRTKKAVLVEFSAATLGCQLSHSAVQRRGIEQVKKLLSLQLPFLFTAGRETQNDTESLKKTSFFSPWSAQLHNVRS